MLMTGLLQLQAQKTDANVFGDVQSGGEHLPFASIRLKGTHIGTTTDETGHYMLTNRFQSDFDNYRNRDSNYVYGPALPRTVYIGIKMKSL